MFKKQILFHSFLLNLILIILHEMDAVFWKEWRIFGLDNDIVGMKIFIIAHLPLLFILLLSLIKIETIFGKIVSLILSSYMILHFFLHYSALTKNYFNDTFSFTIITCIMIVSIIQLASTILSIKTVTKNNT